jgi:hypothetical protein
MERGKVNMPVADVCKGGEIRVAYNNAHNWFEVDLKKNEMVKFYYGPYTFPYEILYSFLTKYQLSPTYKYNYQDWGQYDTTGQLWSGPAAMVRRYIIYM